MKQITTIKLTKKTAGLLNKLKVHPRQAYEEIVLELLKKTIKKRNKKGNIDISKILFVIFAGMIIISGLF